MLWSTMRLIFKTSSVTPDFFYVFTLILSFSTCSESFEKICAWELLGANVLKAGFLSTVKKNHYIWFLWDKLLAHASYEKFLKLYIVQDRYTQKRNELAC